MSLLKGKLWKHRLQSEKTKDAILLSDITLFALKTEGSTKFFFFVKNTRLVCRVCRDTVDVVNGRSAHIGKRRRLERQSAPSGDQHLKTTLNGRDERLFARWDERESKRTLEEGKERDGWVETTQTDSSGQ